MNTLGRHRSRNFPSLLLAGLAGLALLGCAAESTPENGQNTGKADSLSECGDGTLPVCEILPFDCPDGEVHEIVDGCFGECVDAATCEPTLAEETCGDGTLLICEILPFDCPDGEVHEIVDGCFGECVDAATCGAPSEAACQANDLDELTFCATACAEVQDVFDLTDCLGTECAEYFSDLDEAGEDCMNCSFLRGEDAADEVDGEIGAGDAFLAGVEACASMSTPEL